MQNSRPVQQPQAQVQSPSPYTQTTATLEQQLKLRATYSSPMRPSQYVRGPNAVDEQKPAEETPRQAAERRERERVSLEQVLLDRRWATHCASPLFHFHREQLSEYAHDLVKTLRAAALRACGQQFGYSVSIRNTDSFVAFQIREERDRRQARTKKSNGSTAHRQPGRAGSEGERVPSSDQQTQPDAPERSGAFVLYFPVDGEQRAPRKGREKQQLLLLRGNEELLRWVCSWLQRRFQCVVSTHVVHIQQMNLKRLARNWVVSSLLAQKANPMPQQPPPEQAAGLENQEENAEPGAPSAPSPPPRSPLLLKFRATKDDDVVRTYTLTVPWGSLRRLFEQTESGEVSRPSAYVPELIEMVERLYFDSVPFDLSTYEIERVSMEEVAVDLDGGVEVRCRFQCANGERGGGI
ncbi:hypothetical protein BBJ28_00006728 [Nothophytophthora sp. Chile5]|nr:hypothetical protein BBJ28_00006728 [Nothophytophthora sp. Chile5]